MSENADALESTIPEAIDATIDLLNKSDGKPAAAQFPVLRQALRDVFDELKQGGRYLEQPAPYINSIRMRMVDRLSDLENASRIP